MNTQALISFMVVTLDQLIAQQVAIIRDHSSFKALESSWRGLQHCLIAADVDHHSYVRVRMLDISLKELHRDATRSANFEQMHLFKAIYSQELDRPGGQPFGLLVYDYYVTLTGSIDWVMLLDQISMVSAASYAPALLGVAAQFFGVNQYSELSSQVHIDKILQEPNYQRFLSLRTKVDMRFINLAIVRLNVSEDLNRPVYINPAWQLAKIAINSFRSTGWFADMRFFVSELPGCRLSHDSVGHSQFSSLEMSLYEQQEAELSEQGFICATAYPLSHSIGFRSMPALHQPVRYRDQMHSISAVLSVMLPYLLCACRFAHYIKVMMREKVGSLISADDIERFLQEWVYRYCGQVDAGNDMQLAKHPLKNAKISVSTQLQKPGSYFCSMDLEPNFHVDGLQSHLRFVAEQNGV